MTRSIITYLAPGARGCGTALLIAVASSACRLQRANRDCRTRAAPGSHRDAGEKRSRRRRSRFTGRIEAQDEAASASAFPAG